MKEVIQIEESMIAETLGVVFAISDSILGRLFNETGIDKITKPVGEWTQHFPYYYSKEEMFCFLSNCELFIGSKCYFVDDSNKKQYLCSNYGKWHQLQWDTQLTVEYDHSFQQGVEQGLNLAKDSKQESL